MDTPKELATLGTQDTGQINVRVNRRSNQEWTLQRNWQHWVHMTQYRKLKWWATRTLPKPGKGRTLTQMLAKGEQFMPISKLLLKLAHNHDISIQRHFHNNSRIVTRSLILCVCFVDRYLYFFFCHLCCLSFFGLRILITPLVSSNSFCFKEKKRYSDLLDQTNFFYGEMYLLFFLHTVKCFNYMPPIVWYIYAVLMNILLCEWYHIKDVC